MLVIEGMSNNLPLIKLLGEPLLVKDSPPEVTNSIYMVKAMSYATSHCGQVSCLWQAKYPQDTINCSSKDLWLSSNTINFMLAWIMRNLLFCTESVLVAPPDRTQIIQACFNVYLWLSDSNKSDKAYVVGKGLMVLFKENDVSVYFKRR